MVLLMKKNPSPVLPGEVREYVHLQRQIHDALRKEHPEWVEPNGESPICDSYEARLTEQLETFTRRGSNARTGDFPSQ
jgi:23S rRNA maturation mini-RNase III